MCHYGVPEFVTVAIFDMVEFYGYPQHSPFKKRPDFKYGEALCNYASMNTHGANKNAVIFVSSMTE